MKNLIRLISHSLILAVAIYLFTTNAPVFAATSYANDSPQLTGERLQHAASLLKPHFHFDAQGRVSLDITDGTSVGLDEKTFLVFQTGVQQYNTALSTSLIKDAPVSPNTHLFAPESCAGRSGEVVNGITHTVYFNECQTAIIEGALTAGGGAATIAAAIAAIIPGGQPAAVILGIAAGLATIGAGAILIIDATGGFNGTYLVWKQLPNRGGATVTDFGHQ